MTPAQFVAAAETWIDVPWRHQGRSRWGVDCAGVPEAILRECCALPAGYKVRPNYGRIPGAALREQLERWCTPAAQPRDGCLVHMRWPTETIPSHIGILAGDSLIHAYAKAGRVVKHAYREPWVRMTTGYWLVPGVVYE